MLYYTREQIRSFIRCPQLGSEDYGEWGALRLEQRLAISDLLDLLDSADAYIEKLYKENKELKFRIRDTYISRGEYNKAKAIMTKELRYDYIPKSVIREKILKHRFFAPEYMSEVVAIEDIKELLGEEK